MNRQRRTQRWVRVGHRLVDANRIALIEWRPGSPDGNPCWVYLDSGTTGTLKLDRFDGLSLLRGLGLTEREIEALIEEAAR